MTITIQRAKSLCTSSELDLVHWSTSKRVGELSEARLRQKITRARKLRDKFRDLGDRQRREARRKDAPRGRRPAEGNEATRTKQQLFHETLERFEAAFAKAKKSSATKKTSKKKTAKKTSKKKTSKKKTSKKAAGAKASKKATSKKASKKKSSKKKTSKKAATAKVPALKTGRKISKKQLAKKASRAMSSIHAASAEPVPAASVLAIKSEQTAWQAVSDASLAKRKSVRFQKTGQPKIHGHISSRTRRNQAKRDASG